MKLSNNLIIRSRSYYRSKSLNHSFRENTRLNLNKFTPNFAINSNSDGQYILTHTSTNQPLQTSETKELPHCNDGVINVEDLLQNIKEDNIQYVMSLLSTENEEILSIAWNKLDSSTDQQTFLQAISSNSNASSVFLKKILPFWLQSKQSEDVVITIKNIIALSGIYSVEDIVEAILGNVESVFVQDIHLLKNLLSLLSNEETSSITKSFVSSISKTRICPWHIEVLTTLIENSTPPDSLIEKIVLLIERSLDEYHQDRNMGKLLFSVVQKLSGNSPQVVINRIAMITEQFKGLMRLRLRKLLKNLPLGT